MNTLNTINFQALFNATMEGILLTKDNMIVDMNTAGLKIYGIEDKNLIIGKFAFDMIPDDSKEIALKHSKLKSYEPFELNLLRYDKSSYPALMKAEILEGTPYRVITVMDLTKIKEQERLLAHSSKMAQMGEMIGNIAHQWRQPLSMITVSTTGIQIKHEHSILTDEDMNESLESILLNANYLSQTVDVFRNFLNEKIERRSVIIQERIDNALNIIKMRLKDENIELINNIDYSQKFKALIVVGELSQVIINIINNAVDAFISNQTLNRKLTIGLLHDRRNITITISDNAGGIPQDVLPNIFEPYFTTKHKSQGTGIGLYMSYDIVVKHMMGDLFATNIDNGAMFSIQIPIEKRIKERRVNIKKLYENCRRIRTRRE